MTETSERLVLRELPDLELPLRPECESILEQRDNFVEMVSHPLQPLEPEVR